MKNFVNNHPNLTKILLKIYIHLPFMNKIKVGRKNSFINRGLMKKSRIYVCGQNNIIEIGYLCRLKKCNIYIRGNNNTIKIDSYSHLIEGDLYIEDDNGKICIGEKTNICGKTHLACIEGSSIEIGSNCLFSSDVVVRTGDSHSILDLETKARINPSQRVRIGNNVWVGNRAIILKGVEIADQTIIGTGAIVTKTVSENHVVVAGNPARIVKRGIDWCSQRI